MRIGRWKTERDPESMNFDSQRTILFSRPSLHPKDGQFLVINESSYGVWYLYTHTARLSSLLLPFILHASNFVKSLGFLTLSR